MASSTVLLLLLLLAAGCGAEDVTCTVFSGGSGDYASLQAALDGCRSSENATGDDVTLVLLGTFVGPFDLPSSPHSLSMMGLSTDASQAVIRNPSFVLEQDASVELFFLNVTFDFQAGEDPFFAAALGNTNFTLVGCVITAFEGEALIVQEACDDTTTFVMIECNTTGLQGGLLYLEGMHSWVIQGNDFGFSGRKALEFIHLRQNNVSQAPTVFDHNSQWIFTNCRGVRCSYELENTDVLQLPCQMGAADGNDKCQEAMRCVRGQVMCYDRVGTAQRGRCLLTTFDTVNAGEVVDFESDCRNYIPCQCNPVKFRNNTSGLTVTWNVGSIIFPNGLIFECQPAPGATIVLGLNQTFIGMDQPFYGMQGFDPTVVWPSHEIFSDGTILVPGSLVPGCPCPTSDPVQPNATNVPSSVYPCRYTLPPAPQPPVGIGGNTNENVTWVSLTTAEIDEDQDASTMSLTTSTAAMAVAAGPTALATTSTSSTTQAASLTSLSALVTSTSSSTAKRATSSSTARTTSTTLGTSTSSTSAIAATSSASTAKATSTSSTAQVTSTSSTQKASTSSTSADTSTTLASATTLAAPIPPPPLPSHRVPLPLPPEGRVPRWPG